jgi:ribosomal protein L25 (general stress protein Ctc)
MKYGKNKTTESQKKWLEALKEQGYFTAVCYGAEEAERIIARYLQFPGCPDLL